jgi:hypothetical protein
MTRAACVTVALIASHALPTAAQQHVQRPHDGWMRAWAPTVLYDDTRFLDQAPRPSALFSPSPLVGLFWSGGNPAGLAWEATRYAALDAGASGDDGEYRRPLDAGASRVLTASALAWQPIAGSSGVAGTFEYDEVTLDPGTRASNLSPYSTVPFVIMDSTRTGHRLSRMRVEGAGGHRFGDVALGLAVGYDAADGHSFPTRIPRTNRSSTPAATLGAAYQFADGRLRVGAHVGWRRQAETFQVLSAGSPALLMQLNGYSPPIVINLAQNQSYHRRRESESRIGAVSLAGNAGGWSWSLNGSGGTIRERQWSQRVHDPDSDEWRGSTIGAGAAVQARDLHPTLLLTGSLHWKRMDGDARLAISDSLFHNSEETALSASADGRWRPDASPWSARVGLYLGYEQEDRGGIHESAIRTLVESRTTILSTEVLRDFGERMTLAAGYSLTRYRARGSAPYPEYYPEAIQPIAGGENAYYATPAGVHAVSLGARLAVTQATSFHLVGYYQALSPLPTGIIREYQLDGSRRAWRVDLSAVLR